METDEKPLFTVHCFINGQVYEVAFARCLCGVKSLLESLRHLGGIITVTKQILYRGNWLVCWMHELKGAA